MRSWGYLLLPIILWAWFIAQLGLLPIVIMSAAATLFFLLQAKVPCGAEIRDRDPNTGEHLLCRRNATGILGGCELKSHRWQNVKMLVRRSLWGRLVRSLFRRTNGVAASLSALATVLSMFIALGALVVSIVKPS
jgi:hypothetical protein